MPFNIPSQMSECLYVYVCVWVCVAADMVNESVSAYMTANRKSICQQERPIVCIYVCVCVPRS